MASTIQIKRGTGTSVPSGLADGELAINLDNGKLFYGSSSVSVNSFTFKNLTAENYIVSTSVTNITTQTLSGSTDFGDDSGDIHKRTGSLNVSGALSMDGNIELSNNGEIFVGSSGTRIIANNDDYWKINANGVEAARFSSAGVTINEGGQAPVDFRVESNSDTHLLFVDAGANKMAIGTNTVSDSLLTVDGDIKATNITASGNISASGDIFCDDLTISDDLFIGDDIRMASSTAGIFFDYPGNEYTFGIGQGGLIINAGITNPASVNHFMVSASGGTANENARIAIGGTPDTTNMLTVYGNISASGEIKANTLDIASTSNFADDITLGDTKKLKGIRIIISASSNNQIHGATTFNDIISGDTTLQGNLRIGGAGDTSNNWISIDCQNGDDASGGGITFYETGTYDVDSPQYGAKIVYNEDNDEFAIGTMHDNTFMRQIYMKRSFDRVYLADSVVIEGTTPALTLLDASTTVADGDELGQIAFNNEDDDGTTLRIKGVATEDHASEANGGSKLEFHVTPNTTSATALAATIDQDKSLTVNNHITASGNISSSGTIIGSNLTNVENTAISTFAGTSNITTVGTIGTGTWQGTAIADAYLSSNTAHLTGTQTFSGAKTFSANAILSGTTKLIASDMEAIHYDGQLVISQDNRKTKLRGTSFNVDTNITASGNISGSSTSTILTGGTISSRDNIFLGEGSFANHILHFGPSAANKTYPVINANAQYELQIQRGSLETPLMKFFMRQHSVEPDTVHISGSLKVKTGPTTGTGHLEVEGNVTASGNISSSGTVTANTLRLSSTTDASVSSTGHAFQAGLTNSTNVIIDNNEIMARNNGAVSNLHVNPDGGNITFNNSVSDKVIIGSGHVTASGNISSSGTITGQAGLTQHSITGTTDGEAKGDIVKFGGTTSMTAGAIYHYKSNGTWELADADDNTKSDGLLGVALGAASDINGVLLRGMVTLDHDPGAVGDALYLTTTAGDVSATAPSGNGNIVRIVGYCLDASNGQIWFNPDSTFVEVNA